MGSQGRFEQAAEQYQLALANFEMVEAQAKHHWQDEKVHGLTSDDFDTWTRIYVSKCPFSTC